MKAIVCTKYGPPEVLQLQEVNKPSPEHNEVLIKIHATTVTSGDARIRSFNVPPLPWLPFRLVMGWTKPKKNILGTSFAGTILSIGQSVTKFKIDDEVFGSTNNDYGCYAEYLTIAEDGIIAIKPNNLNFNESAAVFFGGHTALHFLRKGKIGKGQSVLIYGASGCLGTYAVQLARHYGSEVTGVCSGSNLTLVHSLGAHHVIDYKTTDFTKNGYKYDIIFDTVGKSSFSGSVKSLKKQGKYLRSVHMTLGPLLHGFWTSLTTSKKVIGGVAHEQMADLIFLKDLAESGHLKPVIDKTYPLEEIIEAHRYVDKGHKKGSVVITIK